MSERNLTRNDIREILQSCNKNTNEEMVDITMIMQMNIAGRDARLRGSMKTRILEDNCREVYDGKACGGEIVCGYMNKGWDGHAEDVNFHYCKVCEGASYHESRPRDTKETGYEAVCSLCNYDWNEGIFREGLAHPKRLDLSRPASCRG